MKQKRDFVNFGNFEKQEAISGFSILTENKIKGQKYEEHKCSFNYRLSEQIDCLRVDYANYRKPQSAFTDDFPADNPKKD